MSWDWDYDDRPDPREIAEMEAEYAAANRARCRAAAAALHCTPNGVECGHSPAYPTPAVPCPRCGSVGARRSELALRGAA